MFLFVAYVLLASLPRWLARSLMTAAPAQAEGYGHTCVAKLLELFRARFQLGYVTNSETSSHKQSRVLCASACARHVAHDRPR